MKCHYIRKVVFFIALALGFFTISAAAATGKNPLKQVTAGDNVEIRNAAAGVTLRVNVKNGLYRVERNDAVWLGDGLVVMRLKGRTLVNVRPDGSASGDMHVTAHSSGDGKSVSGAYKRVTLKWNAEGFLFDTEFRVYADSPKIEFLHIFPKGYKCDGASTFEDSALNFPVFAPRGAGNGLHLFSYNYRLWPEPIFGANVAETLKKWGDGANRTPLLVFDERGRTGILSPFSDYMTRIVRVIDLTPEGFDFAVAAGLNGELDRLEPGHVSKSILYFGNNGVSATMTAWGAELLRASGKKPVDKSGSTVLKYLGYWTDNGAYYYYRTEPDSNYETSLLDMNEYLKRESIPVRYFQLDSWWYPKSTIDKGLIEWKLMPGLFPEGIAAFQKKLGLPLAFHNKYFAADTAYRNDFPFIEGGTVTKGEGRDGKYGVHPKGREVFDLWAADVKSWGGIMYEQDWLNASVERMPELRSDPQLADKWITDLSDAMGRKGLEIQFCMPTMAFYLESTRFQNVTNIRSSNDYQTRLTGGPRRLWYEHIYTSAIISALGALPFKDLFIATPETKRRVNASFEQLKNKAIHSFNESSELTEPFYHQMALLSILSTGPVGIGNRIGTVDKTAVNLMADETGFLVKPDRPLVPIDRMYYVDPMEEPVALTGYAVSKNSGRVWYYVMSFNTLRDTHKAQFTLKPGDLGIKGGVVIYDFMSGQATEYPGDFTLSKKLEALGSIYLVAAPLSGAGRSLIGDTSKYVTASRDRIASWTDSGNTMEIALNGPKGTAAALLIYSRTAPSSVVVSPSGAKIEKVADMKGYDKSAAAWGKAGENLYAVRISGGAGVKIKVKF